MTDRAEKGEDVESEMWVPAPGFPGYEVSNLGRVRRSASNGREARLRKPRVNFGYCVVCLSVAGEKTWARVHRLVAEAFLPVHEPERNQVNHKNLVKGDNRSENLEWVTPAENSRHFVASAAFVPMNGTKNSAKTRPECIRRGSEHRCARLSESTVAMARARVAAGESQKAIALELGVHQSTISYAVRGRNWKHVG